MPLVVGVAFKPVTKVYYFDPSGFEDLKAEERVVVETARGRTLGFVVHPPHEVPAAAISGDLKPVVRRATALDMVQLDQAAHKEPEALEICRRRAQALGLPMKVIRVEYNFEGSSILVYFTAEQRIDFRNLVHDLAQALHARVEMRQIGVRDEAKALTGFGRCGRELCCASWLREFTPVSIKMAKQQDLPLNPTEISGVCGRLLCCLSYENEHYGEARRYLPRINSTMMTSQGQGKVRQVHVMRNSVTVVVQGPNDSKTILEIPMPEIDFQAEARGEGCPACPRRQPLLASSDEASANLGRAEEEEETSLDADGGAEDVQPEPGAPATSPRRLRSRRRNRQAGKGTVRKA